MSASNFARLLAAYQSGHTGALDELMTAVYDELRRVARSRLRDNKHELTLSATGLVNEAFLRLRGNGELAISDRGHFFALASQAMHWVLMDRARARLGPRRGGGMRPLPMEAAAEAAAPAKRDDLAAHDAALVALRARDERLARTVELRYLLGLSIEETAALLEVSPMTVKRDWATAKIWLERELGETKE